MRLLDRIVPGIIWLVTILFKGLFGLAEAPAVRLSAEATLHLWVPLARMVEHRTEEMVVVAGGRQLTVPGYRIGPHFIWGMTERIVSPLLELLG